MVAVARVETQASGRRRDAPGRIKAALAGASKENRDGWRYASLVTPGALRPLGTSADRNRDTSDRMLVAHTPHGTVRRSTPETQKEGVPQIGDGSAKPGPLVFPRGTDLEEDESGCDDDFRRKLAALEGGGKGIGSGPGGALWVPASKLTVGRGAVGSPPSRPNNAKVRRLVRHLEDGLKLKGRRGAGGLPSVGSQRVDLPYTEELAKWSYDEILGIPKTVVPAKPPAL